MLVSLMHDKLTSHSVTTELYTAVSVLSNEELLGSVNTIMKRKQQQQQHLFEALLLVGLLPALGMLHSPGNLQHKHK